MGSAFLAGLEKIGNGYAGERIEADTPFI